MIYNLGIFIYGLIIRVASLFNPKAKKWVEGRKGFWKKLPKIESKSVVWFHCASLGEYDQGLPIMEVWKKRFPNNFLLVTFFSPSGYEHLKNKSIGDYTCYLPLDTPRNAERFITHFRPKKAFFVKYEYWNNFLKTAKNENCELYAVSAIFRQNQRFFKAYGASFRKTLRLFDHFFVQNKKSYDLLQKIDIKNVTISGDTRFDRVLQRTLHRKENSLIAPWAKEKDIFIAGSSWPNDEEIILPLINSGKIDKKVILAPHEIHEAHIRAITSALDVTYQRYTVIEKGEPIQNQTKVLILDCIGILADAYSLASLAYVGGGFGTGLHNILEPAAFQLPVIFGPNHHKFPEAQLFIDEGIGKSIHNTATFSEAYDQFKNAREIRERVNIFMQEHKGATSIVMQHF